MITIIGGGITGLAAAFELHTRSIPFVLLEAADRFGGLIFTEHVDGYTIDAGADSILVQKPAGVRFCEELGLGSRLIASTPPRTAFVHARGRLHKLPSPSILGIPTTEAGIAAYDLLPQSARATLIEPRAKAETGEPGEDESVASFFRREFGPDTVSLVAEPLLGGIHAGDVERLSIASVAPRLAEAGRTRGGALRTLLDSARESRTDPDGLFRSLPSGMGEIVAAIEARIPSSSLRRQSRVRAIARENDAWKVLAANAPYGARAVIVAAPAHAASELLAGINGEAAALCSAIPYVSTVSIALAWPRGDVNHPLDGSGFVVARQHSDLRITACTWASSKWPDRTPPGMTLLRAFIGGAADPDAAALPDDELLAIAVRDVSAVLGIRSAPVLTRVHRWLRAGAQHNVGHRARVEEIERRLERTPGVFVAGSGFRSIGVPDSIADGRDSARRAADYAKIDR